MPKPFKTTPNFKISAGKVITRAIAEYKASGKAFCFCLEEIGDRSIK